MRRNGELKRKRAIMGKREREKNVKSHKGKKHLRKNNALEICFLIERVFCVYREDNKGRDDN